MPYSRSPSYIDTARSHGFQPTYSSLGSNANSVEQSASSFIMSKKDDSEFPLQQVPVHDQRTVLISNLSDRTTHKDITSIIRGGRLLDIFLRHDRTATVSFVEGAAEFLAYAKRNDIYLHQKRVCSCLLQIRPPLTVLA